MTGNKNWHVGDAAIDGAPWRGWVVGHFMDPDDVRMSKDVEIKWGVHPAGDERAAWQGDEKLPFRVARQPSSPRAAPIPIG